MPLLCKDRIHLSEILATDKATLVEHLQEPEIHAYTLTLPFPYTETHAEEFLARINKNKQEQGQPTSWAIRDEAEHLIGAIGFMIFIRCNRIGRKSATGWPSLFGDKA